VDGDATRLRAFARSRGAENDDTHVSVDPARRFFLSTGPRDPRPVASPKEPEVHRINRFHGGIQFLN
jgi:hypothetical protein